MDQSNKTRFEELEKKRGNGALEGQEEQEYQDLKKSQADQSNQDSTGVEPGEKNEQAAKKTNQ